MISKRTTAFLAAMMATAALCAPARAGVAEEAPGASDTLGVAEIRFCVDIENRTCAGEKTQFFGTTGRIWCWTHITGADDTLTVRHAWYYGDELMAEVDLPVRSPSWRTWSSKKMMDGWSGAWRVDVVGPGGEVLGSGEFVYKPLAE